MIRYNYIYGLLIIVILFFSCEMKFPEKWESPTWHVPINIPLQNESYFFNGIADSNTNE